MKMTAPKDQLVGERYRVEYKIGSGGHADVYRAFDQRTCRTVALKIPRSELVADPLSSARFVREAKTTAALSHPNIVQLLDVGEAEFGPYLVIEYLEGVPLSEVISEGRCFTAPEVAMLMLPAVAALAHAHDEGIVHRDFKPANVFLVTGADGKVLPKVVDFGLARSLLPVARDSTHRTSEMIISGTPVYMSPERVRVESHGDFASDVWSVGVVLFELIAGRPPFEDASTVKLFGRIATETPPTLESIVPSVDKGIALIVHKCLRLDPRLRYETARGIEQDLRFMLDAYPTALLQTAVIRTGEFTRLRDSAQQSETVTFEKK